MYLLQLVVLNGPVGLFDQYTAADLTTREAALPLMAVDRRASNVSAPKLMLRTDQPGMLRIGQRVPVITEDDEAVHIERMNVVDLEVDAIYDEAGLSLALDVAGTTWSGALDSEFRSLVIRPEPGVLVVASSVKLEHEHDLPEAIGRPVELPTTKRARRRALRLLLEG